MGPLEREICLLDCSCSEFRVEAAYCENYMDHDLPFFPLAPGKPLLGQESRIEGNSTQQRNALLSVLAQKGREIFETLLPFG